MQLMRTVLSTIMISTGFFYSINDGLSEENIIDAISKHDLIRVNAYLNSLPNAEDERKEMILAALDLCLCQTLDDFDKIKLHGGDLITTRKMLYAIYGKLKENRAFGDGPFLNINDVTQIQNLKDLTQELKTFLVGDDALIVESVRKIITILEKSIPDHEGAGTNTERTSRMQYIQDNIDSELLDYIPPVSDRSFEQIYTGALPPLASLFRKVLQDKNRNIDRYVDNFSMGLLLYGPTGTGKTTLSRALANERSDYLYFELECSRISDKYFGESEKKLRQVFDSVYLAAKKFNTKSILFIDEIDALLSNGGDQKSNSEDRNRKISAIFKTYFGDSNSDEKARDFAYRVIVIGATNFLEAIPDAVARRFPQKIEMPNPDFDQRLAVLKYHLSKIPDQSIVNVKPEELAIFAKVGLDNFNCGDIANTVKHAGVIAYHNLKQINIETLMQALSMLKSKSEKDIPPMGMYL